MRQIKEQIEKLTNSELVNLWNEYCDRDNRQDNIIYTLDDCTLDSIFVNPSDVIKHMGVFNYYDDYFTFNGYGNMCSFSNVFDTYSPFCIGDICDWLEDNPDVADEYDIEL